MIGINLLDMIAASTPDEYDLAVPVDPAMIPGHPIPGISKPRVDGAAKPTPAEPGPKRKAAEAGPPERGD